MSRIFIIGNGYDVARRGDTRYSDFKKWIKEKYIKGNKYRKDKYLDFIRLGKVSTYDLIFDNIVVRDENTKEISDNLKINEKKLYAAVLYNLMEYFESGWNNFEEDLAKLPLTEFIKEFKEYNINHNIELTPSQGSPVDKETELLTNVNISRLFSEWVISLSKKKNKLNKSAFETDIIKDIQEDDIFIIFNYTNTLEDILGVNNNPQFYHIHGRADNPDSIVVGHNNKDKSTFTSLDNQEDYINEMYAMLYKNPQIVIDRNKELWEKISKLDKVDIYEYGWSCSDVDKDYIEKIVECLNPIGNDNIRLYLNDFNGEGCYKKQQWIKYGLDKKPISCYKEDNDKIIYGNCDKNWYDNEID